MDNPAGALIGLVALSLTSTVYFLRHYDHIIPHHQHTYAIARQGIYPAALSSYSTHNCIEAGRSTEGEDSTRCHFKNVCIELKAVLGDTEDTQAVPFSVKKPSSVRMLYYRPEEAKGTPLYWHARRNLAWSWVRIGRQSRLTPEIVYDHIPDDSLWSPATNTVLTESFWPENFAHAMGDDFLNVYRLATSFGLWSRDLQVIMHPDCSRRGNSQQGCEHHAEMSGMLFDRPLETMDTPMLSESQRVCFKNLLVGTRMLGESYPSEAAWPGFINAMKSHYGFQLSPRLLRQKITLFLKNGRRTFLNYEEVADHLRNRFNVEVEIYDPAQDTIRDQIRFLESTTVLISPCGGISLSAMFLPPGASAIFAQYWAQPHNISVPMDAHILTYQSNIRPFQYELEFQDLSIDRAVVATMIHPKHINDEEEIYRSWANVTISLPRMEQVVFSALLSAEGAFDLSDTFKM